MLIQILGWIFLILILLPLVAFIISWIGLLSPGLLAVIVICITVITIVKIALRR